MKASPYGAADQGRIDAGAPGPRRSAPPATPTHSSLTRYAELLGSSPAMRALYDEMRRVAATNATVLVIGESGTGKELVARSLHRESARGSEPFVAVNCGAIPHHMLEAELFGHEKGSFTGAHQQHAGHFERASRGTLLLDEVTEMAPDMQVKLLRVLETGRFYRVGGTVPVDVDLRVIAATNRDPHEASRQGGFREDLLYRLAVFPMRVPPLRERGADIAGLADHFLAELNRKSGTAKVFTRAAYETMNRHAWPGNVRELRNTVQRGFILAEDEIDLPDANARPARKATLRSDTLDVWIGTPLADAQREIILATLAHFDGNKPMTADALGVSLKTLYNRLNEYGSGVDGDETSDAGRGAGPR